MWYQTALQPVAAGEIEKISIQIVEGSSPNDIGQLLQDEGVIRSGLAFEIYVRLHGVRGQLQAGTYQLAASASTPEIVDHQEAVVGLELKGCLVSPARAIVANAQHVHRELAARHDEGPHTLHEAGIVAVFQEDVRGVGRG